MKLFFTLILLIVTMPIMAGPVFIRSQGLNGQGYAFWTNKGCYIVTAEHVIGSDKNETALAVDHEGNANRAAVIATDEVHDLALLVLISEDGVTPTSSRGAFDCGFRGSKTLFPVLDLGRRAGRSVFWLERVASPAGGLDPVVLGQTPVADANILTIPFSSNNWLSRGDSGSAVMFRSRFYDSDVSDYNLEWAVKDGVYLRSSGKPNPSASGDFLGIATSVEGENVRIVPAEVVRDFVIRALAPDKGSLSDVVIINDTVKVSRTQRGYFTAIDTDDLGDGGQGHANFITKWVYNTVSFEFDLGDKDTIVSGIDVIYNAPPRNKNETYTGDFPGYYLDLSLGMERPEDSPTYEVARCKSPRSYESLSRADGGGWLVSCRMPGGRIARSAILDVAGRPGDIRSVEIVVK